MATKTITIDLDAYRRLRAVRAKNESFSQAIKRVIRPPLNVESYLAGLRSAPFSRKAALAIGEHEARRHGASGRRR
ncbi:MAG: hypothetical protein JXR37_32990 [Kiritimatiellae bacterium]|nr:hypothetical protein [Kiritimatiellia bacterium]